MRNISLKYLGPFLWSNLIKEKRMNSLNALKRPIRNRDLTDLIEDGGCKNCYVIEIRVGCLGIYDQL